MASDRIYCVHAVLAAVKVQLRASLHDDILKMNLIDFSMLSYCEQIELVFFIQVLEKAEQKIKRKLLPLYFVQKPPTKINASHCGEKSE